MAPSSGSELDDYPGSYMIRKLDENWSEYETSTGRKIYHNTKTGENKWKPPRKELPNKGTSTPKHSAMLDEDKEQVGIILKEGILLIAILWENSKVFKKKWKKYYGVLTNSHFILIKNQKKKKRDEERTKRIYLSSAVIRKEIVITKRKNACCLTAKSLALLLSCENPVESDIWYHAITTVIDNLCKPKRPKSINIPHENFNFGPKNKPRFSLPWASLCNSDAEILRGHSSEKKLNHGITLREDLERFWIDHPPQEFKFPTGPMWITKFDDVYKRYVYENIITGEIWSAAKRANGGIYFYDTKSFATSLLLPDKPRSATLKETDV